MFKRYSVETKVVKTPRKQQTAEPTESCTHTSPTLIEQITKEKVIHVAAGLIAVYASVVTLKTLSTIAINYAPTN